MLLLERAGAGFTLSFRLRHAAEPAPLFLERGDDLWFRVAAAAVPEDVQLVVNLAGTGKPYHRLRQDLQDTTGRSRATATRAIAKAKDLGLIVRDGDLYRAHGLSGAHSEREP